MARTFSETKQKKEMKGVRSLEGFNILGILIAGVVLFAIIALIYYVIKIAVKKGNEESKQRK